MGKADLWAKVKIKFQFMSLMAESHNREEIRRSQKEVDFILEQIDAMDEVEAA